MPPIEPGGITRVEVVHSRREIWLRGLDEEVKVIVQQHPGEEPPPVTECDTIQQFQPLFAVPIVTHNDAAFPTARHHVGAARGRGAARGQTSFLVFSE